MTQGGTLRDLLDVDAVTDRLTAAGLSAARVQDVREHVRRCALVLRESGVGEGAAVCAFVVPGRIEVLGKHTDYAGGRSILAAPERGITVVAAPRADGQVRVLDVARGESACFALDAELVPAAGWANYPMTAARRLARNFPAARTGADVAMLGDLPLAAGMSSSSAFVVAVLSALGAINRVTDDERYRSAIRTPEDLAGYLATVENGEDFGTLRGDQGVGTRGGSEDHTAIICARAGHLVQYAFAPVRFERALPIPPGHRFVIAASGVHAEKTGAARERYNRAADLMRAAAALWRARTGRTEPTIGAVLDAEPGAVDRLRGTLTDARGACAAPDGLLERVDQFIAEDREIIPAAGNALERGDLAAFGALVDRSQQLAERLLQNQVDETIDLARSAREAGAVAASAFGAGFGGSVWALVADASADEFQARWAAGYRARFPASAAESMFFQTGAGAPMTRIS